MLEKTSTLNNKIALIDFDTKTQFESVFKYATEGIVIVNEKGIIQNANPSIEKLFGYPKDALLERPIEVLIPKRFAHRHVSSREKYNEKPAARAMGKSMDLWALRADGTEFPVEVSLSHFTISDNSSFTMAFIIDISERKKIESSEKTHRLELEKEVENRTLVLKEAIAKLEKTKADLDNSLHRERELNAMKSRFVSIASHEFRTPLSTILSSLSLVEKYIKRNELPKIEKHTDRIKKSIRGLTDILNDILSVNKVDEGKITISPEEFDFVPFLNEIIAEISGLLKKGQRISLCCNKNLHCRLWQDPKLLRHILLNLVSNAIKFSKENSEIKIVGKIENETFHLSVIDQGIGIPEKAQSQLFGRFFRADNAGQIQGTGLGLSIVAQYTKILKGQITFESKENQGSTFSIEIPVRFD